MASYDTNNVHEMDIDRLLFCFQQRMQVLLKEDDARHQMDAMPAWWRSLIDDEIMPAVDEIVDYDPTPQYEPSLAGI